eukprot:476220-Amphidinium_carterae.1
MFCLSFATHGYVHAAPCKGSSFISNEAFPVYKKASLPKVCCFLANSCKCEPAIRGGSMMVAHEKAAGLRRRHRMNPEGLECDAASYHTFTLSKPQSKGLQFSQCSLAQNTCVRGS